MTDPNPNPVPPRRAFFKAFAKPRAVAEESDDLFAESKSPATPSAPQESSPAAMLLHLTREAMACEFEILFDPRLYPQGIDAADHALDRVTHLEQQLTVYRDSSEVSLLNQTAGLAPVPVAHNLFQLFQTAQGFSTLTGGAFDITSGPLSKIWGFYRRQGQMPSKAEVATALSRCGHTSLQLDEAEQTVRFLKAGMEINLGAIGKGYALDQCVQELVAANVHDCIIHGGNSSILAHGSRSPAPPPTSDAEEDAAASPTKPSGWWVGLRHPLRPDIRLAEFCLRNEGLGTSGSGTQYFHHQGKRYGHILDPRTGWPAEQVLSATVIAPTATQSDALSTALYVLGLEKAQDLCDQNPTIKALLITHGTREGEVHLHPLNLTNDDWRLL